MTKRVFIAGAAGLVGQNLIALLDDVEIVCADKHSANLMVLRKLHPSLEVIEADLAEPGPWEDVVANCDCIVMLQAQIGGLDWTDFERNNIASTQRVLAAATKSKRARYLVHVSSSVVNSAAEDFYTKSKAAQEALVEACALKHVVLRPTLMFGWFDRKHVGWLRRFMERVPVFPVPGNGRFLRQPLFAGDFANIISSCIKREVTGTYNISGLEKIDYIDLIKMVKAVTRLRTPIVSIPYGMFWVLLAIYALVDRNPPFTTKQLEALVTPDVFEIMDWPAMFSVRPTPLREALEKTFLDRVYSPVALEF